MQGFSPRALTPSLGAYTFGYASSSLTGRTSGAGAALKVEGGRPPARHRFRRHSRAALLLVDILGRSSEGIQSSSGRSLLLDVAADRQHRGLLASSHMYSLATSTGGQSSNFPPCNARAEHRCTCTMYQYSDQIMVRINKHRASTCVSQRPLADDRPGMCRFVCVQGSSVLHRMAAAAQDRSPYQT